MWGSIYVEAQNVRPKSRSLKKLNIWLLWMFLTTLDQKEKKRKKSRNSFTFPPLKSNLNKYHARICKSLRWAINKILKKMNLARFTFTFRVIINVHFSILILFHVCVLLFIYRFYSGRWFYNSTEFFFFFFKRQS